MYKKTFNFIKKDFCDIYVYRKDFNFRYDLMFLTLTWLHVRCTYR